MDYSHYSKDELISEINIIKKRLDKYEIDYENRMKAKELLQKKTEDDNLINIQKHDENEITKLVEELNIHQIELELQNEELINANQQLAQERELFLELYNQAPLPYLTLNKNGNIIRLNKAASDLLGIEIHKLNYNSFYPFIHDDSKFKFSLHFKNVLDKNDVELVEIKIKDKNGKTIYCQLQTVSYFDYTYNEKICRITVTDISEAKKELFESNEKFELFFNAIDDAVFIHPFNDLPDQTFSDVNKTALKRYGYSKYEFSKLTPLDITDPNSIDREKALEIHRVIIENKSHVFEAIHITKNGSKIPVEINTSLIEVSDKKYVLSIARDISERQKSVEKNKLLNQRIESSMLAGNMAWWEMELPSGDTTFNENKVELLGYNKEDFTKYQDFMKYVHPDDNKNSMQKMRDHISGKAKHYEVEYRIKTINGDYKWFYDIGRMVEKNNENMTFSGIIIDVTDKKKAEIKLKNLNESKNKLFQMIAHDLRSPFTGFLGLSELLSTESETISKNDLKNIASNMHKSANAIFNLINDLLLWARSQSDSIPLNKENLDIYELVSNNIYLLSKTAELKNIKIYNKCNYGHIVNVDRNMIMTVIRNLLDNAIKFSNTDSKIIIDCTDEDKNIKISIEDFGSGINEERANKLFLLGETISTKGTSGEKGTGLGLNICKEFVDRNNGEIWVKSETGKGSTFYFTLPKAE